MKYILKAYSIWEFGKRVDAEGNPHQEDSLYPAFGKQSDSDRTFILCDGMGGHDAGEVASATVCEAMSQSIINNGHDADGVFSDDDLTAAISAAFAALDKKDTGAKKKMGTTMTFLKLHSQGATIAHMGDSRVYQIRPGETGEDTRILFETEDHSLVNDLIKIGELTREEARLSKQKNVITRAMQPNMERKPKTDVHHITDIKPGDYFYMCSDGMLEQPDMENGDSLRNIFSKMGGDDKNKVEILTGATDENRDNHTAIIVHILDVIDPIVVKEEAATIAAMPTKHVAIVNDDDVSATENTSNGNTVPIIDPSGIKGKGISSKDSSRKKKKSHAQTRNMITLLAVIVVGVIGYLFFFQNKKPEKVEISPESSIEIGTRKDNPDKNVNNQEFGEKPETENQSQDEQSSSSGTQTSATNAASIATQAAGTLTPEKEPEIEENNDEGVSRIQIKQEDPEEVVSSDEDKSRETSTQQIQSKKKESDQNNNPDKKP